MNTIDRLLGRLTTAQQAVDIASDGDDDLYMKCVASRDALRSAIAADWQAMVEALEKARDWHRESYHSEDEAFADELDATLARVKGES
jgi:hypothetical protein